MALGIVLCADAQNGYKKAQVTRTSEEMAKLVKDLGSAAVATREQAMKDLGTTLGAVHYLRRNLPGKDAEVQRRMEVLINELTGPELRRMLERLAKEKDGAPVDLLAEIMLQHRSHVNQDDWKLALDIVGHVCERIAKETKSEFKKPYERADYLKSPFTSGARVEVKKFEPSRILADRFCVQAPPLFIDGGAIMVRDIEPLEICSDGVLLLLPTKNQKAKPFRVEHLSTTFLYCDHELDCDVLGNSFVVTRSTVKAKANIKSAIIEKASESKIIKLFSTTEVGLELEASADRVRITNVKADSLAAKSGLRKGDIIEKLIGRTEQPSEFLYVLREMYAKQLDLSLQIFRDNGQKTINLRVVD